LHQVGAEPVGLLALPFLYQYHAYIENRLRLTRHNLPHNTKLHLLLHVFIDPLALYPRVRYGALADRGGVGHLKFEREFRDTTYGVAIDKSLF
jgi:hypothetical protein